MNKNEEQVHIPWCYMGVPISDYNKPPEWAIGMIYLITYYPPRGEKKQYVGKKSLLSTTRKKIGVRKKALTGTKKTYETTVKDSGWQSYNSSNKILAKLLETTTEPHSWTKDILHWAYSKKNLSYLETKEQLSRGLLEKDSWVDNVAGKWYRHDTDRQLYQEYMKRQKVNRAEKKSQNKQV